LTALLRDMLDEVDPKKQKTKGELVVEALIRGARKGKPAATKEHWNRVEGKVPPPQPERELTWDDIPDDEPDVEPRIDPLEAGMPDESVAALPVT
jgi:hypothetical protein